MTEEEKNLFWRRQLSNPELLQLILTIFYFILMLVVSAVEIKGVFLMPAIVMPGTSMEKEFEYWEVAGYSVLLMLSWFFLVGCYRQLIRKAKKMEVWDKDSQVSMFSRFTN